jgi:hypothetical protein
MLVSMNTDNLVLRPNCLMTKYPIVFISGIRSLFFYEKLGKFLQDFIAAHGYVVLSPALPFRSAELRQFYLSNWLKQRPGQSFHFILGEQTYSEFNNLLADQTQSSFTLIPRDLKFEVKDEPLNYRLHRIFCTLFGSQAEPYVQTLPQKSSEFYDRFLDHCVELAENESL